MIIDFTMIVVCMMTIVFDTLLIISNIRNLRVMSERIEMLEYKVSGIHREGDKK